MPKIKPFVPPEPPSADWLLEYGLVYVPGNRKFRCYFCDRVFDTVAENPFGNRVSKGGNPETAQDACGRCSQAILDAHRVLPLNRIFDESPDPHAEWPGIDSPPNHGVG